MGDLSREPSMEDILSSIRRVIARDDGPLNDRGFKDGVSHDVLELQEQENPQASDMNPQGDTAESHADESPAEDLVSNASADAARQSLEALNAVITPAATPAPAPTPCTGGRSMEDVVIDAMRPMLKQWLDANLPNMVEAMVAKEISRITGRRL